MSEQALILGWLLSILLMFVFGVFVGAWACKVEFFAIGNAMEKWKRRALRSYWRAVHAHDCLDPESPPNADAWKALVELGAIMQDGKGWMPAGEPMPHPED